MSASARDRDRSSRLRPTLSCARCYLMKKKCDKKVPSCSRCTLAGTACHGINRSTKTEVPRSAVRYLEDRLAELQRHHQIQRPDSFLTNGVNAADQRFKTSNSPDYKTVRRIAKTAFGSACNPSVLRDNSRIYYEAKLFYGSERPPLKIPLSGVYNEYPPRMASRGSSFRLPRMGSMNIPFNVAKTLFDNYMSNIFPRYPCFLQSDLVDLFNQFYPGNTNPKHVDSDTTWFILCMVLAISSLTSKAHDFRKVASLSESLQRDAKRRSSFLGETSIRSLQGLLLLLQMASLLPYTSNLWYLSGEAMRMAIALGLHEETEEYMHLDYTQINLRRCIFWTVYQLERTIAIASGCPLAISDDHISILMPSNIPIVVLEQDTSRADGRLSQFLSQVHLCQIQSEILGVQFFDQDLPKDTPEYADWMQKIESTIQTWQDNATSHSESPTWSINAANHCRLLLYRPCSRNIVPSESSLQTASTIAIRVISGSWEVAQASNLVPSFQYVYNVFQAGMIILYALRNHSPMIRDSGLEEMAHQALDLLTPLFEILSARWPAAIDTGRYVKELKDTILRGIHTEEYSGQSAYDVNLLAELDFMVTQRRIHSLYHRNVEIRTPEERMHSEPSPWPPPDSFTPIPDELWQEFINTSFEFLGEDSFVYLDPSNVDQSTQPTDVGNPITSSAGDDIDVVSLLDVDTLIESLPACGFCRGQHVKCDRKFPSCGACKKSDRECVYYDVILQENVSRSYIYDLYNRIHATGQSQAMDIVPAVSAHHLNKFDIGRNMHLPCYDRDPVHLVHDSTSEEEYSALKVHDNLFFGRSSPLAMLDSIVNLSNQPKLSRLCLGSLLPMRNPFPLQSVDPGLPSFMTASTLFHLFSISVNVFYPTMKSNHLTAILANAYTDEEGIMLGQDQDLFYFVLAISSHMTRKLDLGLAYTPAIYFQKAIACLEKSRHNWIGHEQLLLLQRTILICIYLLLSPTSGDIWRNLGFAIRFYFDLSHRPSEHDGIDEELMRMLSRTLYCLESQISIAFGRPSLLVIGDTIRENIAKPMAGTIEERISAYFYRISLLKLQAHSKILSGSHLQDAQLSSVNDESYRQELKVWFTNWKEDVMTEEENDGSLEGTQLFSALDAWATFHYHHALLLASHDPPSVSNDTLGGYDSMVKSCSHLSQLQQKTLLFLGATMEESRPCPVFPITWNIAHLLFSAGLGLCAYRQDDTDHTKLANRREGIQRGYLAALARLEGDPENLSTGLSEVLEQMIQQTRQDEPDACQV